MGKIGSEFGINRTYIQAKPEVLAIIPARSGSKGIPRKNIQAMGGKPLLAWSIEAALASCYVTRVIVSTDDPAFAELVVSYGVEVPFLRPKSISGDQAILGDVFAHVLDALRAGEGYVPDVAVYLFPTHPFRPLGLIDHLVEKVLGGYQTAITVAQYDSLEASISNGGIGFLNTLERSGQNCFIHQGLVNAVRINGGYRKLVYLYRLTDKTTLVDIDTPEDLELANKIVDQNLLPKSAI